MADPLLRHWHLLRSVPRAPRKISSATLHEALAARGFSVNRRTVQRDLQTLSTYFPLVSDERHRPFGWSWSVEAAVGESLLLWHGRSSSSS